MKHDDLKRLISKFMKLKQNKISISKHKINVSNENNVISLSKATHSYCISKHLNNLIISGEWTVHWRCLTTQWRTPGLSVSVVVGLHFVHFVVLLGEVQRVFIIVLNGHEAAVTTMTTHEGEGVVVLVDLGGSYRLPVASIPKDRENINSQLLILFLFIFHVEN